MLQALAIRDFRLMWTAGLISSLGSWLLILAVPAHVFLVTRSFAATGLTLAADYAPLLILGPVAGALADRWDRRRLMIASDLFRAAAVAAMLLALAPGRYWIFYITLAAESGGTVLFMPALQARTPAIVGTGTMLSSANALNALGSGVVRLIGGPLGGILLVALGIKTLVCADAVSYLVSAAGILMTSRQDSGQPDCREGLRSLRRDSAAGTVLRELRRELQQGIGIVRSEPAVRALLVVTVIFLAANASLTAVVVPFGLQRLGGSQHTGYLFAALGVGYLIGAPILRVLLDTITARYALTATLGAAAASYLIMFSTSSLPAALPAAAAVGMFGSMTLVIAQTAVQRLVPNAALGRITALFLTGEAAVTLIGSVTGPLLAQRLGLSGAAAAASLATVSAALLACLLVPAGPAGTA